MAYSLKKRYILRASGQVQQEWVGYCLQLFKVHHITIQKLSACPSEQSKQFSSLECQFFLPSQEHESGELTFLEHLRHLMLKQPLASLSASD